MMVKMLMRVFLGPAGFVLLIYFTYNAIFVGQRLGLCWIILERKFPELKEAVCL